MTLVLENGRLVERQVTYISSGRRAHRVEDAYEEFWSLLKTATSSRFSGPEQTCLALSGGLDSGFVGAALACHTPEYHAFSLVSARRPDLDETSAIEAFRGQHRRVQWHPMACDETTTEIDSYPVTDDPVVAADPLKYARRDLMRCMSDHGFTSVLGGEGGDELFAMSRRIGDFASPRHWLQLARALANQKRKRAVIWRGLVVPKLPRWGQALWAWREHRRLGGRPWLSPRFWEQDAAREAREQAHAWASVRSTSAALRGILEHPANVGSNSAQRLLASSFGLELRAPMLDRAVLEFVLGLPPELLWTSSESKPFLRAAGRGRLPPEILHLKKHLGLHRLMRDRALAHEDAEAVARLLQSNDLLVGSVDANLVADCLGKVARGLELPGRQAEALYALIATARWMRSVVTEYGTRRATL
jgi:asparagine synthetase B (glutamine-hydrolysing)